MRRAYIAVPIALLAAVQLVPLERTNPPVVAEVGAPPEVKAILERACYDCHSTETRWGLQAYIAPLSWLVVHNVNEGRRELNFSLWGRYAPRHRQKAAEDLREEMEEEEMPPTLYTLVHPEARLSQADRAVLVQWAREVGGAEPARGSAAGSAP
jgi:hypothetical protein